jgi:hypothetical protein
MEPNHWDSLYLSLSSGGENVSVGYFKLDEKTREEFYTDGNGTRWFREGPVLQSVSLYVITSFTALAMKCVFTFISGTSRSVNCDDIDQCGTTML